MTLITRVFGWAEIALAAFSAFICAKGVFGLATSDANDMTLEWAPLVIAITLPISLSLVWSGWHLIKRQDWLHQAVPFFVILTVAVFLFAMDY
jgi:flagellar biosynthesis protein FliQ